MLDEGRICEWKIESIIIYLKPDPNISRVRYSGTLRIDKFSRVADKTWATDLYMTRWRYNQKRAPAPKEISSLDTKLFGIGMSPNKNNFNVEAQKQLETLRLELKEQ